MLLLLLIMFAGYVGYVGYVVCWYVGSLSTLHVNWYQHTIKGAWLSRLMFNVRNRHNCCSLNISSYPVSDHYVGHYDDHCVARWQRSL